MRLEKIKLAGFKSFVDPTTVSFPSHLVGVIGPNGCGKSNVIDAVRWVMGESSAKMLRGESMEDVIFNGSTSRKPVGTATIELVFDNSEGRAGGQYAQYNQISVKRQVSRDGQSLYFLNNVRCRRKDITDLFLGTGLGPRSYSIIEQGMISRIIEARPEDLRVYLEEAAGISKYKERRRETENRIRHTKENLDRLSDLIEEVGKQLKHLERQAATAEKFRELKTRERQLHAELLALKWRALDGEREQSERRIAEQENRLQATVARQRRLEADIEQNRARHAEANDGFNEIQGRFYSLGAEIARLEQSIQFARENHSRLTTELDQVSRAVADSERAADLDGTRLAEVLEALALQAPALEEARTVEESISERLTSAEQAMQDWQNEWDSFNQQATEPAQSAQVERTRINHLEQRDTELARRLERIDEERKRLEAPALDQEIADLVDREQQVVEQVETLQEELERVGESIAAQRQQNRESAESLDRARGQAQSTNGRLASLETLQQAALGKEQAAASGWLDAHGLAAARRIAEQVETDEAWRPALEAVLGNHLQAVCVDSARSHAGALSELEGGAVELFETAPGARARFDIPPDSLVNRVKSDLDLASILAPARASESVEAALADRASLAAGQFFVTREAVLVGPDWIRFGSGEDAAGGVLAREEEMRRLRADAGRLDEECGMLEARADEGRQQLHELESRRDERQNQLDAVNRTLGDLRSQLTGKRTRADHLRQRLEALTREVEEVEGNRGEAKEAMETARQRLHEALETIESFGSRRETLIQQRDSLRQELDLLRQEARDKRAAAHALALQIESLRSQEGSLRESRQRLDRQLAEMKTRRAALEEVLSEGETPIHDQQQALEEQLQQRVNVEAELTAARQLLGDIDAALREQEQARGQVEQEVQREREALEQGRMQRQEFLVREKTLEEQLAETEFQRDQLLEELPDEASVASWQEEHEKIGARIQRLGPINLAAIDEFREQSERMEYLESQYADVTESLETLEDAIRKIDRETRTRFRETFDKVDAGIKELFPKLFGGGHAYLELTGEDLLDTGVSVMARPPGKRNASIHLLSGGEKALTAVALVFAIFQLNPAPFCMLDEVDAPLDDANVGRFCDMVQEMSERVQFIFITHNKITMELANQLMGVTMHEPGVSRLVSVDVEEAAQLAAV
jgi:chromosome segregation protein